MGRPNGRPEGDARNGEGPKAEDMDDMEEMATWKTWLAPPLKKRLLPLGPS